MFKKIKRIDKPGRHVVTAICASPISAFCPRLHSPALRGADDAGESAHLPLLLRPNRRRVVAGVSSSSVAEAAERCAERATPVPTACILAFVAGRRRPLDAAV